MLELRPNCENCDCDLPPHAESYICSYECTFCPDCTDKIFEQVCPNCGGELVKRPVRPVRCLTEDPPSFTRIVKKH
ncbi:DUF1272 domain-containing protein [Pectobacterium araliae]|uniref:DUF1272 domain-containing protein n=1 Tax=Pectobacterium araliae TaxID=3073862 RepID=UPI0030D00037